MSKRCTSCKKQKPSAEFYVRRWKRKDGTIGEGLSAKCKKCQRNYMNNKYLDKDYAAKRKEYLNNWKKENPNYMSEYQKANKEKIYAHNKARRKRGKCPKEHISAVAAIYKNAQNLTKKLQACVSTDDPYEIMMQVDHIIPIALGGITEPKNLQIISARENYEKGARAYSILGGIRYF